jgi:hypothetical protein
MTERGDANEPRAPSPPSVGCSALTIEPGDSLPRRLSQREGTKRLFANFQIGGSVGVY